MRKEQGVNNEEVEGEEDGGMMTMGSEVVKEAEEYD